jgi:hypothetical protein
MPHARDLSSLATDAAAVPPIRDVPFRDTKVTRKRCDPPGRRMCRTYGRRMTAGAHGKNKPVRTRCDTFSNAAPGPETQALAHAISATSLDRHWRYRHCSALPRVGPRRSDPLTDTSAAPACRSRRSSIYNIPVPSANGSESCPGARLFPSAHLPVSASCAQSESGEGTDQSTHVAFSRNSGYRNSSDTRCRRTVAELQENIIGRSTRHRA